MCTITYEVPSEGTMEGEAVQEVTVGVAFTLNKLTRTGYTGYWTLDGKEFKEGVWTLTKDVTLKAVWKKNSSTNPDKDDSWTNIY